MKIDLETALKEVWSKTGFNSSTHSRNEHDLAKNGNLQRLRNSYAVRLRAVKCVQDVETKKRTDRTIKNLMAQNV